MQGKFSLAEPFFRRAVEGLERTLGPAHPDTLRSVDNLRTTLQEMEKEK